MCNQLDHIKSDAHYLDTLALPSTNSKSLYDTPLTFRYRKKSKAKLLTDHMVYTLVDHIPKDDPLYKSVWNSWHCSRVHLQEGDKMTAKYCNNRWCIVCSRIRTAKMINGYSPTLLGLDDLQFVTLSIRNVKGNDLKSTIDEMFDSWTRIRKNLHKNYPNLKLKGIRKIESTYNNNPKSEWYDTYHPHFHLLISGLDVADKVLNLWMKQYPNEADRKGQKIIQANEGSVKEVFKYFSKMFTDTGMYPPEALITMFKAMHKRKVYYPLGIKKITEDVDDVISETIDFKDEQNQIWVYDDDAFDWVSPEGELLSGYKPSIKTLELIQNIKDYDKGHKGKKDNKDSDSIYSNRIHQVKGITRTKGIEYVGSDKRGYP